MILKLNRIKRSIPESFKHEYTIFPVPRPSTNLYPPPPIRFNVVISNALNVRPIQNSYATFACDTSIERRPTLIRGRGICLHIHHILKLQNCISVLNVLVVFEITLCEHNLNFGKTKQYAIRQIKLQNWTEETQFKKKRNSKKMAKVWPSKAYPVGMEAITSKKTRMYKEKTKTIFETEKWEERREDIQAPTIE